jgi:hypothetical protein
VLHLVVGPFRGVDPPRTPLVMLHGLLCCSFRLCSPWWQKQHTSQAAAAAAAAAASKVSSSSSSKVSSSSSSKVTELHSLQKRTCRWLLDGGRGGCGGGGWGGPGGSELHAVWEGEVFDVHYWLSEGVWRHPGHSCWCCMVCSVAPSVAYTSLRCQEQQNQPCSSTMVMGWHIVQRPTGQWQQNQPGGKNHSGTVTGGSLHWGWQ